MFLNLDKVGDRTAIAKISASQRPIARAASSKSRVRQLLGGSSVDELLAGSPEASKPDVMAPFHLEGPSVCLVPKHQKQSIGIGIMSDDAAGGACVRLEKNLGDFARAEAAIEDLPPEVAEALHYYAEIHRQGGSFKVWQTCWKLVVAYCLKWQRKLLPMSVGTATGIVLHMARVGYAYGYIRNVRWTISKAHRLARCTDPTLDDGFRMYLKIIAGELGTESIHRKTAILFPVLRRMAAASLEKRTIKSLQDWTAMCCEWFSVLRRENLVELNIEDLRRARRGYEIHVRRGKNHQTSSRDILVGPIPEDPLVCPVLALDRWLAVLGQSKGPLFRHLGPGGAITDKRLSGRSVTRAIKRYVAELGLPPDGYATQSMRRGMITQALLNGVNQADLRELTGHEHLESLDPYYSPGELAPNLSIAATYGERCDRYGADTLSARASGALLHPQEEHYAPF
jgi:hypothetical protein